MAKLAKKWDSMPIVWLVQFTPIRVRKLVVANRGNEAGIHRLFLIETLLVTVFAVAMCMAPPCASAHRTLI